jgi:hypothetical protein
MITYRDAIRPSWIAGLTKVERKPKKSLRDWLRTGSYSVITTPAIKGVVLENVDPSEVLESFTLDINRFASAAHESICNIRQCSDMPRSTAWPLVTVYYSALFYSHALLRVLGNAPSYLEAGDIKSLKEIADLYGVDDTKAWKPGIYSIEADLERQMVCIAPEKAMSGSHIQLWKTLERALLISKKKLQDSPFTSEDRMVLEGYLDDLISAVLGAGSNSAWLSSLRNSIQYKQRYGLWFPYNNDLTVEKILERLLLAVRGADPLADFDWSNRDELISFRESCCLLIAISRGVIMDVVDRSGNSVLRFGLPRAENTLKLLT